ncbi:MAG: hypothetical protein QOD93_6731, partial [Acetobacteraceae bacterium]|nr:hypothetical protein [Acetobacteraceae bacterium]
DSQRLVLLENSSLLSLAFTAITASPITATAAIGLVQVPVDNGNIAIGARNGSTVDPTKPATATINFRGGGRVTLAQLTSNPVASISASYTGAIQATLPLASPGSTANLGITWLLDQPNGDPQASLKVPLTDPALTPQAVLDLDTLVPWAAAVTSAADQTGVLATQMPLVNQTLAQLSGLAPATSGNFSGVLNEIASAIQTYAAGSGASTDNFLTGIQGALAGITATYPAYTFTVSTATAGESSDPSLDTSLSQPLGTQVLQFNLIVTATHAGSQTLSLSANPATDNVAFSTAGTTSGSVTLNITIDVALAANLAAQDATFVQLNGLSVQASAGTTGTFPIGVGLLGASVTGGSIGLNSGAAITLTSDGAAPTTVSNIIGNSAANLVTVTEQTPSAMTGTLAVASSFGDLTNASANLVFTGDPLGSAPPTVHFTGNQGTNFQSFANLAPTDLLGGLSELASVMNDIGQSSPLAVDIPLTNLTVGQATKFGSVFEADIVNALSNNQTHTPTFNSIQQFEADLAALTAVTNSSVTYNSGSNQIGIAFTLAENFPATPASFTYDLTGAAGTILGDLTNVLSTSATATLSVSGTGSVAVGFNFGLTPNTVQIQADKPVPTSGVLSPGSDASFTLALSAPGVGSPTVVKVPVPAAATQSNTTATQLLANINTALQTALTGAGLASNLVTATFAPGTSVLVLNLIPGAFTSMTVTTTAKDAAAYELGLAPKSTPTGTILGNAALPSTGKLTNDATFTVTADGGTATPITITAASTASNSSRSQLLTQVQNALAPLNATLAAANRSPIVVSLTSSGLLSFAISGYASTLTITSTAAAQTGLGLAPSNAVEAGAPVVSVQASAGAVPSNDILTQDQTFSISVDGRPTFNVTVTAASTAGNTAANAAAQNTTPQQMLTDEINAALAPVNADLASAGLAAVTATIGTASSNAQLDAGQATTNSNGVLLFSTLGSSSSIVVKGQTNNQLGIGPNDRSAPATLSVAGGQSFANNIQLTKLSLNANLSLTGSIGATGDLGVVAIDLGPGAISINPTAVVSVYGGYTLAALTAVPSQIGNYVNATLGGAASVTLPVTAADGLGPQLGLDTHAALTLNATDMFTLAGWTADTSKLEGLNSLVAFNFADAKAAVTQLGSLVTASVANPSGLFGQIVPLINQPLGTVMGITQDFANLAGDLQPGTNFTLDQLAAELNTAVAKAFNLPTSGSYVGMQLTGGVLQLTLTFTPSLTASSVPLNFKLSALGLPVNSNLPGVSDFGGSNVTVTPSASFKLVLDIDLTSPTNPLYELGSATK